LNVQVASLFHFLLAACVLCICGVGVGLAQVATGTVTGTVRDPSGGVIAAAQVSALSRATALVRTTITVERGDYSLPALVPGEYEIRVEAAGFDRVTRTVRVEAGTTSRTDIVLRLGDVAASVRVQAGSSQMHYDSAAVGGVITRDQIEGLPLNGRSFLELAKLEPGVQSPTGANRNRTVVPILGAPAANIGGARFTIDGGSVTAVGLGGSQLALSQEAVQEFHVSTATFDLANGMTDVGAINVVSRGGGNERQASAFYFFRDHHLAAYPALQRDANNPEPFFQRQQYGAAAGGPIRRNRVFYFVNWERNDQRAVAATTMLAPDFAHLSRITPSPLSGHLFTARVDARITDAHTVFVRHSYDGSQAFGPAAAIGGGSPNAYPSNWNRVVARADQSLVALTSVLGLRLINDLRVSFFAARTRLGAGDERDCARCLGFGAPSITILQAGVVMGSSTATDNDVRRFHLNDSLTWQRGAHRVRVGISWEHHRERNLVWANDPVTITLFSPDRVRAYNAQPGLAAAHRIALPTEFRTLEDILRLPVHSLSVGVGNPGVPQANGSDTRGWNTVWLYVDDVWRLNRAVTMTYGLGWGVDTALNHDLRKPILLAPILGADGLGPTQVNWTNVSPVASIAWTPSSTGQTVVRAGAGRYYRPYGLMSSLDAERVALGPPGLARQSYPGSSIRNVWPDIPGLPLGAALDFRNAPTSFTGSDLLALLPAIRAGLADRLANGDATVQQIQITKQASPAIFPAVVPNPSAIHASAGVQQELPRAVVVSADVVYRHFVDVPQGGGAIDVNHFDSVRGAAVPECSTVDQANDPEARCSLGAINVQRAPYHFTYRGLLFRVEKRLTRSVQVLGSYAYSSNTGTNIGSGFDLDNWLQNRGPVPNDVRHVLNVSGVLRLPSQVDLGFNWSYASAPPFSAYLGGIDFNGDGTTGDLLPGTTVNAFNRGMNGGDLERLVTGFNDSLAGTRDARGVLIPSVTLPDQYSFGDSFHALDLRISRALRFRGVRLTLIGEVFNVFNAANFVGYSGDLTSAGFGQPTTRATQVFGSGGPRSFQVAARVTF
jgi:hypothetical protein